MKILKIIAITLLVTTLLIIGSVAGIYGYLQTASGQKKLESIINKQLADPDSTVVISGLSGSVPFSLRLASATISDRQGEWLKLENAALDWGLDISPLNIKIRNLEVAKINLIRQPIPSDEAEPETPLKFEIPEIPAFELSKLSLPHIRLTEQLTGEEHILAITGNASNKHLTLSINSLQGPELKSAISINSRNVDITLDEAPNGVIGRMIGLLPEENLNVEIKADGTFPQYNGTALIATSEKEMLKTKFQTSGNSAELAIKLDAEINPPQRYENFGRQIQIAADTEIKGDSSVIINHAKIVSDNINLDIKGVYSAEKINFDYSTQIRDLTPYAGMEGHFALSGNASGDIENLNILGKAEGAVQNLEALNLDYNIKKQADVINISQLSLNGNGLNAKLSGNVDLASESLKISFNADTDNLARFVPDAGGAWVINGNAEGKFSNINFTADAEGNQLAKLPPQVLALAGNNLKIHASGSASDEGVVNLDKLTVNGQFIELTGKGSVDSAASTIDAEISASISDASKIDNAIKGSLKADANIKGTFTAPEGKADITLTHQGQTLNLGSFFALNDDMLTLKDIIAKTTGLSLTGNLQYNLKTSLADGKIDLDADSLSGLNTFLADKISGSGKLNAVASSSSGRQVVDAAGRFAGIEYTDIKISALDFTLKSSDLYNLDGLNANIAAKNLQSGENVVDSLNFAASGKSELVNWNLDAVASAPEPAKILAEGTASAKMPVWSLGFKTLSGNHGSNQFALLKPANIRSKDNTINIDDLSLNVNGANVSLAGDYSPAKLDIKLNAASVPLNDFTEGQLNGTLSAAATLTGSAARPVLQAQAEIPDLTTEDTSNLPLNVKAVAQYENGMAKAISNISQQDGTIDANISVPLKFSLEPFVFDLPSNGIMNGSAKLNMVLDSLTPLFLPPDQTLKGHVTGDVNIAGTLDTPQITGHVNLANAYYNNVTTGTLLENMQGQIDVTGDRASITNFTAKAGKGSISANAVAMLAAPNPINASLKLNDAELLQSKMATGIINGDIALNGDATASTVSGNLVLGPLDVNIPGAGGVTVETVELRNPEVLPRQRWQKKPAHRKTDEAPSTIALDIKIDAPSQVFVRGRGLETEMRGALEIKGTTGTPSVEGELRTVRGVFKLLDRDLEITEGVLAFRGSIPPSPFLRINAETTTNEITAGIQIGGSASEPTLTLVSNPTLPQDEILAHLLFGRELREITPMQGAQLVRAMNTLRGGGDGGFDPLGTMREAMGVDRLNVDANDSGEVTVGAGKYITDKIYVGVEGGSGEGAGKVKAEIEAMDNVTIETQSGANSSGASINWKYDY